MKKFIIALIALATLFCLFSCGDPEPCAEHIDDNKDGVCDRCDEVIESNVSDVALVVDGEAQFQFVFPASGASGSILKALGNITTNLRKYNRSIKVSYVNEKHGEMDVEVLVGNVTTRGAECDLDEHSLGKKGYVIKIVGTKIVVAAGSDEALLLALDEFANIIMGVDGEIAKTGEIVMSADMEVYKPQDNYKITSLSVGNTDMRGYTIATHIMDNQYRELAQYVQDEIYAATGYWLDIVDVSAANKSIVIKRMEKDVFADGFRILVSGDNLVIECAYDNMLDKTVKKFVSTKITSAAGAISFKGTVYTEKISEIWYDDYGAKGDGRTNDFQAIKAAHEMANQSGQKVIATPGKRYLISDTRINGVAETIVIKTNVSWTGAEIIIDDTNFSGFDGTGVTDQFVFTVKPNADMFKVDPSKLQTKITAGVEQIKIEGIDFPVMIIPYYSTHKIYRRIGYGNFDGKPMHEIIVLDENGNVSEDTRVVFDYERVTSLEVYNLNSEPITIEGGLITTRASRIDCVFRDESGKATGYFNGFLNRGLAISRPFTTVKNIEHRVEGEISLAEQAEGKIGAIYHGFFWVDTVYDVKILDCVMTGRRCYSKKVAFGSGGSTGGSYDYSVQNAAKVVFENCVQANFWIKIDSVTGEVTPCEIGSPEGQSSMEPTSFGGIDFAAYWGLGGCNYTKNMILINTTMSRYDAHCGLYDGLIVDSCIGELSMTGAGELIIENTDIYLDGAGDDGVIGLRTDYGATWEGTVTLDNVTVHVNPRKDFALVLQLYNNWDFGYVCAFPNLVINDIKIVYEDDDPRRGSNVINLAILTEGERATHLSETQNIAPRYAYLDLNNDGFVDGTDVPYVASELSQNYYGVSVEASRANLNPIKPPEFIKIVSNKYGYVLSVAKTDGYGISDGNYYDDDEKYGGFFGDTKFYYNEENYFVGTANEGNETVTFN
ncbi:MAG: hypothetical protein J6V09_05130 [Clostridia bacterium]|nr:hypothetical protein [Clostridia bacterium]